MIDARRLFSLMRVAALVWLATASAVQAHPTPGSVAFLDFTVDGARLEQDVPIEELERALKRTLGTAGEAPEQTVRRHRQLLLSYPVPHLRITSGSAAWRLEVLDVVGHPSSDGPRARYRFAMHAPDDSGAQSVQLHDQIITHEVVSHYLTVYLRSDWAQGLELDEPRVVGVIHAGKNDLIVERAGSFWRGFAGIVRLGIDHIATGTDHLLFLLALVLVAPVQADGGRWKTRRDIRTAALAVFGVVSAFTIAHSLTLALGAFNWVRLPSAAVEAVIAVSVLVTAVHALRPLFAGREAWAAAAFGLVHGLAFADTIADRGLGRAQMAWTLLGFNVGIELAQLALLALTVPWLLVLAQTRVYGTFRAAVAIAVAVFAGGWLVERTTNNPNYTGPVVAWLEAHPLALLSTLATLAVVARAACRDKEVLAEDAADHA